MHAHGVRSVAHAHVRQEAGFYFPSTGVFRTASYVEPSGVKNHGIRASAAQWAARCGATVIQIMNMGRWKNTDTCAHYLAQGNEQKSMATQGKNGLSGEIDDPIKRVWWWQPVAVRAPGGRDGLQR